MTNDLDRFDQFYASVFVRIEGATTTDEVIDLQNQAKAMAAAARSLKDQELREKAETVKAKALRKLGMLMAAQRDAGLMNKGGIWQQKEYRGNEYPSTLGNAHIDKNMAKAAREAYPEGWPPKPKRIRVPREELESQGRPATAERYKDPETGVSGTRIKFIAIDLATARARIAELEADNARLKSDLEAMLSGDIMRLSKAAMIQRKALKDRVKTNREIRLATGTTLDDKTKEMFEGQIKSLKTQLRNAKSKVGSFMANGKTVLTKADRKSILVCLHPDGVLEANEKKRREKAFQLFSAAIPEPEF